jgi:hypothetical protein
VTISFDSPLDIDAVLRAPAEEKRAVMRAYYVHVNPANPQQLRDSAARFFYKVLLQYASATVRN